MQAVSGRLLCPLFILKENTTGRLPAGLGKTGPRPPVSSVHGHNQSRCRVLGFLILLMILDQSDRNLPVSLCSKGSMQFPFNPLTMRMLSSTPPTSMACPSPSMQSQQQPGGGASAPSRAWEREPPLLSEQYETLSDSDD